MHTLDTWIASAALVVGAAVASLLAHRLSFSVLRRITARTPTHPDAYLVRRLARPAGLTFPLIGMLLVLPMATMPEGLRESLRHGVALGLIGAVAWGIVALLGVLEDWAATKYPVDAADNLEARRINTQIKVLRRVVVVVVGILAISLMLMTFPAIRQIGTSLLASAGLAGLVAGMALRSTLANLFAGIQIAITQPIRLEDAVIVEGEWGWIEEITTTYVVVKVWDLRRLVLPLTYFVEKPFQNWTRTSARLLGSVHLYVDYGVPLEALRAELTRILGSSELWMGEVCVLQVTDAKEHTVELRALMDAKDSGSAWDLRCLVREKLIDFLRREYPQSLPRARVELDPRAASALPAAMAPFAASVRSAGA